MSSDDLYNLSMVFERTHGWHFSEVTLTHRMLCILALLNGKRPLAGIYEALNITYDSLFSDLQSLHDLHLIKIANPVQSHAEPPGTRSGVKIVYYRVEPCEPDSVDTSQEKIRKQASRTKQGCYRGAAFDVKA